MSHHSTRSLVRPKAVQISSHLAPLLVTVLACLCTASLAATPIPDSDGDGVPDAVEYWMARNGAPVSPLTANVFVDTDGDGIPDLVETYFTQTNPNVSDNVECPGGGGPVDLSGQFDTRIAANLSNSVNFLTDDLSAISVCHTGSSLRVFSPRYGYANTTSLSGTGPYTFSATWNNGSGTSDDVVITGTCPAPCTAPAVVITGTTSIGGVATPSTASRRTRLAAGFAQAASDLVYGLQVASYPKPANPSSSNPSHIGSDSFQMAVIVEPTARLDSKGAAAPGYIVRSLGMFAFALQEVDSVSSSETQTGYLKVSLMFTEPPVAGAGGMVRGEIIDISDSNVNPTTITRESAYGRAQVVSTFGLTINTSRGLSTILSVSNVPVIADQALISGPGLGSTTLFSSTDPLQRKDIVVTHRSRIPAFTDGEQVGLGAGVDVSDLSYVHPTTLSSGTYAFDFTGGVGPATYNVNHVDYSSSLMSLITGVLWDDAPLTRVNNVNMSVAHTLKWNAVTTGGIGNNGVGTAGTYRITFSAPDGAELDYPWTSANALHRFFSPAGAGCASGGTCSYLIAANTLGPNEGYVVRIEARDDSASLNRSRTARFAINVPLTNLFGAVLPASRSVQVGQTATAFATIVNAGVNTGYVCELTPSTSIPASFTYQTTNPATNALVGQPNTPVMIMPGAAQTFVFALTPTAAISPTNVQLSFKCLNSDPAPIYANVNTLLLSAATSPIPDVIALAATVNNDGIVSIPGTAGTGFFAVATANVGASGTITASADTGGISLPLTLWICETNPGTGSCLAPLSSTVTTTIGAGATPTFAVFAAGSGTIPFDPANNRVVVRFTDAGSVTRGATSVAVRTQ